MEAAVLAREIKWTPFPGGQVKFLSAPFREVLGEGNRGGGKTETLLMDYARDCGRGFGSRWKGILFRREYKQLDDVISKSKRLFMQLTPRPRFLSSKSDYKWVWPTGEELLLRVIKDPDDYWNYHGQEFPWMGWEELTTWPDAQCYDRMMACNRCAVPEVPKRVRMTTNPFGAGHGWVKHRFIDPAPDCTPFYSEEGQSVCRINMSLEDNKALMEGDPDYIRRLDSIKNENLKQAWRYGNWEISVGGFLAGIWDRSIHMVEPFTVPKDWKRWRALDWGFARPFSVGWYAQDPESLCIYRYRELYGWGGEPNVGSREKVDDVAARIKELEADELKAGIRFTRNPADSAIWNNDGQEHTVGELFNKAGVRWMPAKKGPGSRLSGAQILINHLDSNTFKVFSTCNHWLRTVPVLMPDDKNWEDIDTDMEDHAYDETRYSLVSRHNPNTESQDDKKRPKPGSFDYLIRDEEKPKSFYRL